MEEVKDNTIEIEWKDDWPAPEELLKLSSCKCSGQESPCNTKRCVCKANSFKCTSFCNCNIVKCKNPSFIHVDGNEDPDVQENSHDSESDAGSWDDGDSEDDDVDDDDDDDDVD
jgi:hypothetical protein